MKKARLRQWWTWGHRPCLETTITLRDRSSWWLPRKDTGPLLTNLAIFLQIQKLLLNISYFQLLAANKCTHMNRHTHTHTPRPETCVLHDWTQRSFPNSSLLCSVLLWPCLCFLKVLCCLPHESLWTWITSPHYSLHGLLPSRSRVKTAVPQINLLLQESSI